jgi:hypothetical protein
MKNRDFFQVALLYNELKSLYSCDKLGLGKESIAPVLIISKFPGNNDNSGGKTI